MVSYAGLAPVLALAERAGLSELISDRVVFRTAKVKSAGVNPAGKLTSVIAGMAAGADSIDDLDVIGSGGPLSPHPLMGRRPAVGLWLSGGTCVSQQVDECEFAARRRERWGGFPR